MTLHEWRRPSRDEIRADPLRFPSRPPSPYFWVVCDGCEATLVTDESKFPGSCHVGWKIPEDCEETVIERIMVE